MGFRGTKSKIEQNSSVVVHGELMAKKWLDSIEKQKRGSNVCDEQTDRQTESTTKNNRLLG